MINLKHGTNPLTVKSYRYPQSQKDEIEKLIDNMLLASVIKCPIVLLLMKKKYDSWSFCVDWSFE